MRKKRTAAKPGTTARKPKLGVQRKGRNTRRANRTLSAKLSVPKVTSVVPRARLTDWLERHAQYPLTWISGPPGCGKTTTVAFYLQGAAPRTIWYRLDGSDTDLPTVFHNLREAAQAVVGTVAAQLPLLTPEYLLDVPTFGRNFFRLLFALLDIPVALVFDNAHDAAPDLLEAVLSTAVAELPEGMRIIAISRNDTPPAISALQVKGKLARLGWERLRLTLDEARAIAANAGFTNPAIVHSQHLLCDGWVAGLVLLLEHARQVGVDDPLPSAQTRGALFSYFSGELFSAASASAQRLLLSTALLPSFTIRQAATFSSLVEAQQLIEWLLQRNFFIDAQTGPEPAYRYHDLFREFLLERGRREFTPDERRALLMQAANGAEAVNQPEMALALALEAESWADAARLICVLAPQTLQQGRAAVVERWISALPAAMVTATPWILYWQGLGRLIRDPAGGRQALEAAYGLFEAGSQPVECLLTCAGIIQSFFLEWGDQHPLDPWVERYRDLLDSTEGTIPAQIEAQLLPCMMGLILRHLGDPLIQRSIARAWALIERELEPAQLVPLLFLLLVHCQTTGEWQRGLPLLEHFRRVVGDEMFPLARLYQNSVQLTWHAMCAQSASESEGRREIQHLIELADRSGIHVLDVYGLAQGIYFALNWHDPELAQQLLVRMGPRLLPTRIMDMAHYAWLRAVIALERGDAGAASAQMDVSMAMAHACGTRFGLCQNRILAAQVYVANGDSSKAHEVVDLALAQAREMKSTTFEHAALLVEAYVHLRSDDLPAGLAALLEGLTLGRRTGQSVIAPTSPSYVSSLLYATALHHGIEVDYVRGLIRTYRIRPPDAVLAPDVDLARWPWPVRVFTLGRFSLVTSNGPVRMSGKAQKKPLQVLQALIALGGRSVSVESLTRQVWPRHGAGVRANLNVALMRLRRLFDEPDALLLSAGRLTLNARVCWVDLWAFERAAGGSGHPEYLRSDAVLDLYRGDFLVDDDDLACVSRTRDRLAAKYQRMALEVGLAHEAAGNYDRAAHVYRTALERDNLVERFHHQLISCEWKLGHRAEALRCYRRCKSLLELHLHARPGREIERLVQRIQTE